ncbi:MAG: 30S ribosomal protein S17 [bacterium]|nr:30S ribosomal protein S17 [bacterium]
MSEETGTVKRVPRTTRIGLVTSDRGDKTLRVAYAYTIKHPKYGKFLRRRATLHVHDEGDKAKKGDRVEVMMCRPVSKTKCWRLVRVLGS